MLNRLRGALKRLRGSFDQSAEDAYGRRDDREASSREASYADGEAHAYGMASDRVRGEQKAADESRTPD